MKTRHVMVCSGGGVKGYSQAIVLRTQEALFGPLHEYYDLIVGTSVGSINGAAIATGKITAKYLVNQYPSWMKRVFHKRSILPIPPIYDRRNFISLWISEFGWMSLGECKTKMMITSINRCDDRNHYFKSWTNDGLSPLASDLCKSFAAPFYFGQLVDETNKCVWTDGGCGTSNLSLEEALMESLLLGWIDEEIVFDVYGTGFVDNSVPFKTCKKQRTIKQLFDFIKPGDGGLARAQSLQDKISRMKKLAETYPNIHFKYWDIQIPKKYDGLDKVKYMDRYYDYGIEMAKKPLIEI